MLLSSSPNYIRFLKVFATVNAPIKLDIMFSDRYSTLKAVQYSRFSTRSMLRLSRERYVIWLSDLAGSRLSKTRFL